MGQKHKPFREFRTPFPLRDIHKNPRSNVRACAAGDGAIGFKNRKIVPYHGANPNNRNGARLRSPSPIMAPGHTWNNGSHLEIWVTLGKVYHSSKNGSQLEKLVTLGKMDHTRKSV